MASTPNYERMPEDPSTPPSTPKDDKKKLLSTLEMVIITPKPNNRSCKKWSVVLLFILSVLLVLVFVLRLWNNTGEVPKYHLKEIKINNYEMRRPTLDPNIRFKMISFDNDEDKKSTFGSMEPVKADKNYYDEMEKIALGTTVKNKLPVQDDIDDFTKRQVIKVEQIWKALQNNYKAAVPVDYTDHRLQEFIKQSHHNEKDKTNKLYDTTTITY